MSTKTERERRKRKMASTAAWLNDSPKKGKTFLRIPKGVQQFNPNKPDAYEIDIVPYEVGKAILKHKSRPDGVEPGDWYPSKTFYVHYGVGPDNDQVLCPTKNFGKPCPICEHRQENSQDPKANYEKDIQPFLAKDRQVFLVVDHKEREKGVQIWEIAYFNFGKQLQVKINKASPKKKPIYEKFFDPDEGLTVRVVGSKESMGDKGRPYMWFNVDEFQERDEPLPDEIMDHGICLDDIAEVMSYEAIKKLFHGTEEDDAPTTRPSRNGAKAEDKEEGWGEEEEKTEESQDPVETEVQVGDKVVFEYKGDELEGVVDSVNAAKGLAKVKTGKNKFSFVKLDELSVTEAEEDEEPEDDETVDPEDPEDEEPAPKPRTSGAGPKAGGIKKDFASGVGTSTKVGRKTAEPEEEEEPEEDDDDFGWGDDEPAEEEEKPKPKPKRK